VQAVGQARVGTPQVHHDQLLIEYLLKLVSHRLRVDKI